MHPHRLQIALLLAPAAIASAQPCTPHWDQRIGQPGTDAWAQSVRGLDGGLGPTLYIGGGFTFAGGTAVNRITRWDGSDFGTFGTGIGLANGSVWAFEVYDDGSSPGPCVFAGGDFLVAGGVTVNRIGRWNGSAWSDLAGGLNGEVRGGMKVFDLGDGSGPGLYMGGDFLTAGGVTVHNIARWDSTGWSGLAGGMGGATPSVRAMAVYDDGTGGGPALFVGGGFSTAGGVTVNRVAKWDGASWSALGAGPDIGANAFVRILAVHTDSTGSLLIVGGDFTTINGQPINRIAKWDGQTWSPLGAGMDAQVRGIVSYDDGSGAGPQIYASGSFTHADGKLVNFIARWDGTEWQPLGQGLNNAAFDMTVHDDGSGEGPAIYVGGPFTMADGQPCNHVARFVGCKRPCAADLNGDGEVDFADFLLFLNYYDAGDPRADFNHDGEVDFADYLEFLNLYDGGC
ncbi:MAG: hypothetical protein IT436_01840 [Phycisphaerales bacterium]|nr:hypothetical protein [Phycisphaerales bacterium]